MPIFDYDSKDRKKIRDRTKTFNADYRLDLGEPSGPSFSFLAVGDTGDGDEADHPQYAVAEAMAETPADLMLHLGDVVYLSGSREGYPERFIEPFRHFLLRGRDHRYNDMVFTRPFLPVYGNHDYYDFRDLVPLLGNLAGRIVDKLGSGSQNGSVFERAFVEHRPGRSVDGVLPYDVSRGLTRIPNRYYWFTYGPCAFYALDTNTLEGLSEVSEEARRDLKLRRALAKRHRDHYEKLLDTYREAVKDGWVTREAIEPETSTIAEELVETLKEVDVLEDALDADARNHDRAQLEWLGRVLADPAARGRWKIVYMHHPFYTSEARHTDDTEFHGLRTNLREILLDAGVHLVLCGHSHCFEWVAPRAGGEGEPRSRLEAERRICYLVSGGGGRGLEPSILQRTSRYHDDDLRLRSRARKRLHFQQIAESRAWASLRRDPGEGEFAAALHHFLRIEVSPESLDVHPVGIEERDGRLSRPARFPVLRLESDHPEREWHLEHIRVRRDQDPEGCFEPL